MADIRPTQLQVHILQPFEPSAYPFRQLDDVVLSPHRASSVVERDCLRAHALARLLNAAATGEPLPNRVDLEAGY